LDWLFRCEIRELRGGHAEFLGDGEEFGAEFGPHVIGGDGLL